VFYTELIYSLKSLSL